MCDTVVWYFVFGFSLLVLERNLFDAVAQCREFLFVLLALFVLK